MPSISLSPNSYDKAVIINELERRYYLYLIGGDYERLFYTFSGTDNQASYAQMQRIKLDVEVGTAERAALSKRNSADPDYQNMLEYLLQSKVDKALQNTANLIEASPEIFDTLPLLRSFSAQQKLSDVTLGLVKQIPWLEKQIFDFLSKQENCQMLSIERDVDPQTTLNSLSYPQFYWLLPKWTFDQLNQQLHPSLQRIYAKIRSYSRIMSGAIACLSVNANVKKDEKWQLYILAALSVIPITILLTIVNSELVALTNKQSQNLTQSASDEKRQAMLSEFQIPGDMLRRILQTEEFIKPHVFESLGMLHFNPVPLLMGYAATEDSTAAIFHQARAYSFYRQLYKTGRIHTHETAVFLKQHNISKQKLTALNQQDLAKFAIHFELLHRIVKDPV